MIAFPTCVISSWLLAQRDYSVSRNKIFRFKINIKVKPTEISN